MLLLCYVDHGVVTSLHIVVIAVVTKVVCISFCCATVVVISLLIFVTILVELYTGLRFP